MRFQVQYVPKMDSRFAPDPTGDLTLPQAPMAGLSGGKREVFGFQTWERTAMMGMTFT